MDDLIRQDLQGNSVRIHIEDGIPWFVAKDVCSALDIINVSQAVSGIDDDEKGVFSIYTPGGNQELLCVNEQGLYELVFKSRKPEAKAFKKWVKKEVLPEIRRTGSYQNKNMIQIDPSKNQPEVLQLAADQSKKLKDQEKKLKSQEPYVIIANEFLIVEDSLKLGSQVAKELGYGRDEFFRIMREEKFFFYSNQHGKKINLPYRNHELAGRVVVKNIREGVTKADGSMVFNDDGSQKTVNASQSYLTSTGQAHACMLLRKREERLKARGNFFENHPPKKDD